ncbi:unnamed protein product [Timema podura]|uniref:Fas-binding factor 1 C-terminal domain-containing protein n=1 Tax=Timema podura TaxID=61482 RepID=A0ABN7NE76_TIMPD|nr:unnamed protein product [Timema podura]
MANFYGDLASDINSDDDSQISDLDPIQVAKMVEDMDDLDADLFGSSAKKKSGVLPTSIETTSATKKSSFKSSDKSGEKLSKSRVSFDSPNKVAPVDVIDKGNKFNFGDFDTNDPLADLLSDDELPTPKKKSSKRNVVSPTNYESGDGEISVSKHDISPFQASSERKEKSKVIADLFGLEDNAGINKHAALSSSHEGIVKVSGDTDIKSSDWLGLKSPTKSPPSVPIVKKESEVLVSNRTASTKKETKKSAAGIIPKDDDDDLLEGMGFVDRNKTTSTFAQKGKVEQISTKPKSILDELMGKTKVEMPKVKTLDSSSGTSKNTAQVPNPISFGGYSPSVSTTREPRRSGQRRNSGAVADPLGIFTSPTKNTQVLTSKEQSLDLVATPNIKSPETNLRRGSQPDWLGLSSSEDKSVSPAVGIALQSSPKHTLKINPEQKMHDLAPLPSKPMQDKDFFYNHSWVNQVRKFRYIFTDIDSALSQNITLLSGAQFDRETAAAFMRQEQQLLMALHLKQHEEQLASLHHRQQDLLCKQELQLQELVNQQLSRQKQVEDQLKKQQERINLHIQTLMSQPLFPPVSVLPPDPVLPPAPLLPNASLLSTDSVLPETPEVNQSHAYLKNSQADLEARHQEEVLILENLYKRHIALLESSLERLEHRLRGENSQLEKEYQAKIEKLQEEQRQLEEAHRHKLASLQEERLSELKQLKELHQMEVEELRERYTRAAETEQDTTLQARSLKLLFEQLGHSSQQLTDLQDKVDHQKISQLDVREVALKAKEAELESLRASLERQRASSDQERRKLLEIVADLEMKGGEQRAEVDSKKWELQQESARLEARTQALEKERHRALAQLEQEKRDVQVNLNKLSLLHLDGLCFRRNDLLKHMVLKQSLLEEQKQLNRDLREEQLKIGAERSRLQALARLQGGSSALSIDAEQEVLEMVEEARLRWYGNLMRMEKEKIPKRIMDIKKVGGLPQGRQRKRWEEQLKVEAEAAIQVAQDASRRSDAEREKLLEHQCQLQLERRKLQELERDITTKKQELDTLTQMAAATKNEGLQALDEARNLEKQHNIRVKEYQQQLMELKEREHRLAQEKVALSQERVSLRRSKEQKYCAFCRTLLEQQVPTSDKLDEECKKKTARETKKEMGADNKCGSEAKRMAELTEPEAVNS